MSPDSTVSELETVISDLNLTRYFCYSTFCLLLYDHFLTISDEIHLVWQSRSINLVKVIFVLNRYLVPIFIAVDVAMLSGTASTLTNETCRVWLTLDQVVEVISLFSTTYIITLRIRALWTDNREVNLLCQTTWALHATATTGIFINTTIQNFNSYTSATSLDTCTGTVKYGWLIWVPAMVFHFVIFALLILKAVSTPRNEHTRLTSILLVDGFIFFAVVFGAMFANLLIWAIGSADLAQLPHDSAWAISTLAITRLLLSLQHRYHGEEDVTPEIVPPISYIPTHTPSYLSDPHSSPASSVDRTPREDGRDREHQEESLMKLRNLTSGGHSRDSSNSTSIHLKTPVNVKSISSRVRRGLGNAWHHINHYSDHHEMYPLEGSSHALVSSLLMSKPFEKSFPDFQYKSQTALGSSLYYAQYFASTSPQESVDGHTILSESARQSPPLHAQDTSVFPSPTPVLDPLGPSRPSISSSAALYLPQPHMGPSASIPPSTAMAMAMAGIPSSLTTKWQADINNNNTGTPTPQPRKTLSKREKRESSLMILSRKLSNEPAPSRVLPEANAPSSSTPMSEAGAFSASVNSTQPLLGASESFIGSHSPQNSQSSRGPRGWSSFDLGSGSQPQSQPEGSRIPAADTQTNIASSSSSRRARALPPVPVKGTRRNGQQ